MLTEVTSVTAHHNVPPLVFDALQGQAIVIDRQSTIVATNAVWDAHFGLRLPGSPLWSVGGSYRELTEVGVEQGIDGAPRVLEVLEELEQGGAGPWVVDCASIFAVDREAWKVSISAIPGSETFLVTTWSVPAVHAPSSSTVAHVADWDQAVAEAYRGSPAPGTLAMASIGLVGFDRVATLLGPAFALEMVERVCMRLQSLGGGAAGVILAAARLGPYEIGVLAGDLPDGGSAIKALLTAVFDVDMVVGVFAVRMVASVGVALNRTAFETPAALRARATVAMEDARADLGDLQPTIRRLGQDVRF